MNPEIFKSTSKLIGNRYATQADQAKRTYQKIVFILIEQRKLPQVGWSDHMIECFLAELSSMDSNNFHGNVGLGEIIKIWIILSLMIANYVFYCKNCTSFPGNLLKATYMLHSL